MPSRAFLVLALVVFLTARSSEAQAPCSAHPRGEANRALAVLSCPGDFETIWLTLLSCQSEVLPHGLLVVAPAVARLEHEGDPQRIAWAVNGSTQGLRYVIEFKDLGDVTLSKNLFPDPPGQNKEIKSPGKDSYLSAVPTDAEDQDVYQYSVRVFKGGQLCAEVDPQVIIKDDGPPNGEDSPGGDDPDRD